MKTPSNKVPSQNITTKPMGMDKGAPSKKTPKMPMSKSAMPMGVNHAAPGKKKATIPSPTPTTTPYGNSKHGK